MLLHEWPGWDRYYLTNVSSLSQLILFSRFDRIVSVDFLYPSFTSDGKIYCSQKRFRFWNYNLSFSFTYLNFFSIDIKGCMMIHHKTFDVNANNIEICINDCTWLTCPINTVLPYFLISRHIHFMPLTFENVLITKTPLIDIILSFIVWDHLHLTGLQRNGQLYLDWCTYCFVRTVTWLIKLRISVQFSADLGLTFVTIILARCTECQGKVWSKRLDYGEYNKFHIPYISSGKFGLVSFWWRSAT